MLKRKITVLGLSAAAVAAVVGAAFAGWTFTSDAKKEHDLGVDITAAFSFGTIDIAAAAPDKLVLDQSGITLEKTGTDGAVANVTAVWTVNADSYADAAAAGLTYAANVYIKDGTGNGLSYYVNCGSAVAETTSAKTGYTQYTIELTPSADDIATSGGNTAVTLTLANPFDYVAANKPDDLDAYKDMVAAIKGVDKADVATDTEYSVSSADKPVIIEFTVVKTVS